MATVTGLTADRMLAIEAESIVDGFVDAATGHLHLTKHDGTDIDAGYIVDQSAVVDIATDQANIDGFKTFLKKQTIQIAANGVALHIGKTGAGNADALNVTPYGAASVAITSGADFDGAASTARAASAAQLEFVNGALNLFANTGLVAGTAYARTKVLGVGTDGQVTVTRTSAGSSIVVNKEAASMGGGSLVILRSAPATQPQSLVFSAGIAQNFIIGRDVNSDHLLFGIDGGGGFVERARVQTDGRIMTKAAGADQYLLVGNNDAGNLIWSIYNDAQHRGVMEIRDAAAQVVTLDGTGMIKAKGTDHYLGGGAFGAGNFLHVQTDATWTYIKGDNSGGLNNGNLHIDSGSIYMQLTNSAGEIRMMNSAGTVLWSVNSSGRVSFPLAVNTATTVGGAGGASGLPATPVGYLVVSVAGVDRKIPYYNV